MIIILCHQFPHRKSLNLSETLLRLAEAGHYETVKSLFSFPMKHCPDVLLLALLQINVCSTCYYYVCLHVMSWENLLEKIFKTCMASESPHWIFPDSVFKTSAFIVSFLPCVTIITLWKVWTQESFLKVEFDHLGECTNHWLRVFIANNIMA